MSDPKEFSCFDDDPENHGWGYNYPEPIEEDTEEENIDEENDIDYEEKWED